MTPEHARSVEFAGRLRLLVVDEDAAVRAACCEIAAGKGHVPHGVASIQAARTLLNGNVVDVLLLDIKMAGGMELLEELKEAQPELPIIVMTAFATVSSAVEAMRTGATDFLTKPFSVEEFSYRLQQAAEHRRIDKASRQLREQLRNQKGLGNIIGTSPEMEKLYRILSKVTHTAHPVLILGESGTGKELVARSIHANGPRASEPFLPADCGSLSPASLESELFGYTKGAFSGATRARDGLLVAARGGTVFLNEVCKLPLDLQAKLVRTLQEKEIRPVGATSRIPVQVRILAATSHDLAQMVEKGSFRKDLYYRLNVVSLRIPPLRERRGDIIPLAQYFLDRCNQRNEIQHVFSDAVLRLMAEYSWPGNVRELEEAIERACMFSTFTDLLLKDFPTTLHDFHGHVAAGGLPAGDQKPPQQPLSAVVPLAELERKAILQTLKVLKGDKLTAAKLLGIGKTTLYRKLKEYGIRESSV